MVRYRIKYRNEKSQVDCEYTYALGGDELSITIDEIHRSGCFVDWIGSRDSMDTLGHFHEISILRVMTKEQWKKNFEIEQHAYDVWGL